MEEMEIVNIPLYVCIKNNIANNCNGCDSLYKLMQASGLASIEIAIVSISLDVWHF